MVTQKIFKIILADDDPDDRDLFQEAITIPEITADFVINGSELMNYLNQANELPDCIFLDLNMPEKGGKECLEEIRADKRLEALPVVIYSTSSSKKDIEDTFSLGANVYVIKPSSFAQIQSIIENISALDWDNYPPHKDLQEFVYKLPKK